MFGGSFSNNVLIELESKKAIVISHQHSIRFYTTDVNLVILKHLDSFKYGAVTLSAVS